MTQNLDNALHGLQESRTALMIESGDAETLEEMDAIDVMQIKINEIESLLKVYGRQ